MKCILQYHEWRHFRIFGVMSCKPPSIEKLWRLRMPTVETKQASTSSILDKMAPVERSNLRSGRETGRPTTVIPRKQLPSHKKGVNTLVSIGWSSGELRSRHW